MARGTLLNMCGFETGGLEETSATASSPTVVTAIKRSGSYSVECQLADSVRFAIGPCSTGVTGFGFHIDDPTPSADTLFCQGLENGTQNWALRLNTSGLIEVFDATATLVATSATAPFAASTQHYVEVFWKNNNTTGGVTVVVDGVQVVSATNIDTILSTATDAIQLLLTASTAVAHFDDFYAFVADNIDDRIGPSQVFAYQNFKSSLAADAGLTTNNSAVTVGNWSNAGATPLDASGSPVYSANPADGAVLYDDVHITGPHGLGPSGGAYDVSGTIRGAKWIWRLFRGGGAGSTHSVYYGNSGATPLGSSTVSLTTSAATYTKFPAIGSEAPTAAQVFGQGFGTGGAQDITCDEMWAMLLHTPAADVARHRPTIVSQARQRAATW